jgi:hypothetical protein
MHILIDTPKFTIIISCVGLFYLFYCPPGQGCRDIEYGITQFLGVQRVLKPEGLKGITIDSVS